MPPSKSRAGPSHFVPSGGKTPLSDIRFALYSPGPEKCIFSGRRLQTAGAREVGKIRRTVSDLPIFPPGRAKIDGSGPAFPARIPAYITSVK